MFEALIRRFLPRAWQQVEQCILTAITDQTTTQRIQNDVHNGFAPRISPATVAVGLNSYALFEPHTILTSTPRAFIALKATLIQQHTAETQLKYDTAATQDASLLVSQAEIAASPYVICDSHQDAEPLPNATKQCGDEDNAHDTSSGGSSEPATSPRGSGTVTPDSSVEDGDQLGDDDSHDSEDEFPQYERVKNAILQGTLSPLPDLEMSQAEDDVFHLDQDRVFDEDSILSDPTMDDPTTSTQPRNDSTTLTKQYDDPTTSTQPHDNNTDSRHLATAAAPVPHSNSTSTSSQSTGAILPPLVLPAWSDDGDGNMWEEAFDELNEAAQVSSVSAIGQDPQPDSPLLTEGFCQTMPESPIDDGLPRCVLPRWSNAEGDMWKEAFDEVLETSGTTTENVDGIRPSTPLPLSTHCDAETLPHNGGDEDLSTICNTHDGHHEPTRLETIPEEDESVPHDGPAPLVEYTKYHYTSQEGQERLEYIKFYLSVPASMPPTNLVLFFIEPVRRRTLRQAAWDNPAFLPYAKCIISEMHFDTFGPMKEKPGQWCHMSDYWRTDHWGPCVIANCERNQYERDGSKVWWDRYCG
ncbi:hypothetical protein GE09DRAFT_1067865 [Coniochaeta sp. 2T2.1]|nr:hypothetical protein GE09DRAFT_1067865 [Coniochaeta sp. 2T2.1]